MSPAEPRRRVVGRYVFFDEIASGGMATVHLGRLFGSVGFSRMVAIKRLHASYAKDPGFVAMFVDEARLAARIRHPNVVPTLDVVSNDDELFLVLEYVEGEALSRIFRALHDRALSMPIEVATSVVAGALHGLHAAHEAKSERGEPLRLVHRDVSPHNLLVGVDGVCRVFDFGIAKAVGRLQTTREGQTKGKLAYMSPEQARGLAVDRRTDVYAASVVLWEALTGRRLFEADDPMQLMAQVLAARIEPPGASPPLDAVVMRGLASDPDARFATAQEMAIAIEAVVAPRPPREIGEWLEGLLGEGLRARAERVAAIESGNDGDPPQASQSGEQLGTETSPGEVQTAGPLPAPRPKKRRAQIGAGVALACVAGGLVTYLATRTPATPAAVPPPAASSITAAHEVESAPAPASAAPIDVPTVVLVSSARAAAPARPPRGAPARPRPTSSCDPPFTIDANGFRHPRPECLHLTPVAP